MRGLPDLYVTGNLTADPELRYLGSGRAVANFTVAATERKYDRDAGGYVDAGTTFVRAALWGTAAENLAESGKRGDRVMVHGSLRQRSYDERESGQRRTVLELEAHEVALSVQYHVVTARRAARNDAASSVAGQGQDDDPWSSAPIGGSSDPG